MSTEDRTDIAHLTRKANHASELARLVDEWASRAGALAAQIRAVETVLGDWQAEIEDHVASTVIDLEDAVSQICTALTSVAAPNPRDARVAAEPQRAKEKS